MEIRYYVNTFFAVASNFHQIFYRLLKVSQSKGLASENNKVH